MLGWFIMASKADNLFSSRVSDLRSMGFSYRKIANMVGVSHTTVQNWVKGSVPSGRRGTKGAYTRQRLHYHWKRNVFPRDITDRINPVIVEDGLFADDSDMFIMPVMAGKIPAQFNGGTVMFGVVEVTARVVFDSGEVKTIVSSASQFRNEAYNIPVGTNLNNVLLWGAIAIRYHRLIWMISQSDQVTECIVTMARVVLKQFKVMGQKQFKVMKK
jgi:hypothetical protein